MITTNFWRNPFVLEEMTPEDKYFYLYLLTNSQSTPTGSYKITKKQIAFDLGYSIEEVNSSIERFTNHHKIIRYNSETRELAFNNWEDNNLSKPEKPDIDHLFPEEDEAISMIFEAQLEIGNS
ncbi:hypothetical protein F4694_004374 [Bacillus niacini]|uniref:DNA replication protein DnaD n=1 Tax=Neobacillus niacini TaxID=86668 RepID=A0A852TFI0_9BACI|nr:hypothetical protein [Neobacillus niacini]NYE07563.1 hypothetical protein [Neobacillus niacini]